MMKMTILDIKITIYVNKIRKTLIFVRKNAMMRMTERRRLCITQR